MYLVYTLGEGLGRGLDKLRSDKTQVSSRLAAYESSIYPAWRTNRECVTGFPTAIMKFYCKLFSH